MSATIYRLCSPGWYIEVLRFTQNVYWEHLFRIVNLAVDYMRKREAFGRKLMDWPLHTATLARMEMDTRGCFFLLMETARLLGRQEAGMAEAGENQLLRLLTPILKLYTGKLVIDGIRNPGECREMISGSLDCKRRFGGHRRPGLYGRYRTSLHA